MRERRQPVQSSEVERLLHLATFALPFCSTHGQACVSLPLGRDGRQFWPVRSSRFRDWRLSSFLSESEFPPADRSLRRVLRAIEARAHRSGATYPLHLRVAARGHPHRPNSLTLDLANHCGDVVEISPHGWEVTPFTDICFRRSRGILPLPRPAHTPADTPVPAPAETPVSLEPLRALLNLAHPQDWHRILAWLLAALRPALRAPLFRA